MIRIVGHITSHGLLFRVS